MEKRKTVLKIESFTDGFLVLSAPNESVRAMLKGLVDLCKEKYSGFMRLDMSPPYKPRTTCQGGQNRKIWSCIQQIAEETGNELQTVEDAIKERAMARGYPYEFNPITGKPTPASMANIDTHDASLLIDELYKLAGEYNITLDEGV